MKETGRIIKEYYNTMSSLIAYYPCDEIMELERQVLKLLCQSLGCPEQLDVCWTMIEDARCLQYAADKLLLSVDGAAQSIALDMKMDELVAGKVEKLCCFDQAVFVQELKTNAGFGIKSACKLLAVLNWFGIMLPQNQETAQRIWAMLAMSGERFSLDLLIYSHEITDDTAQYRKWSHIRDILRREQEMFSAIALKSNYPDYNEEELETANLIVLISQRVLLAKRVDRAMLYYALQSKDDFKTKMYKLSADTNYYVVLHDEDRAVRNRCGF